MIHEILHLIAGAVIGGLIGYCTNYLAIRMLFRPREEKRIGNFKVPFTPGVIPRRKDKLAREIGEAVAQKVFTDEDISGIFTSEGMKQTVADLSGKGRAGRFFASPGCLHAGEGARRLRA